jgi:hypothetical protein
VLSPAAMVGLPMVSSWMYYLIIYLCPIGLLVMTIVLNKGFEIWTERKIIFYLVEILLPGLVVIFVLVTDPITNFVLVISVFVCVVCIIVEMAYLYYSGVNL